MKQIKKNMSEKMDLTVVNKMSEFGYEIHKAGCRDLKNKRNVMDHKFTMVLIRAMLVLISVMRCGRTIWSMPLIMARAQLLKN